MAYNTWAAGDKISVAKLQAMVDAQGAVNTVGFRAVADPRYVVYEEDGTYYRRDCKDGVVDDNGADAVTVIEQAFTDLTSGRDYMEKVTLKGDFAFASACDIPSYTWVDIRGTITLDASVDDEIFENEDESGGNTFIKITGGVLDGNHANQTTTGYGIKLKTVTTAWVDGVTCKEVYYDGFYIDTCNYLWITNNYLPNNFTRGIHAKATYYSAYTNNFVANTDTYDGIDIDGACTYSTVANNVCVNNPRAGIFVEEGSRGINVVGNVCDGNLYGIELFQNVAGTMSDCSVVGNICRQNDYQGIRVGNATGSVKYLTIADNVCLENSQDTADTYDGIRVAGDCTYITVSGNVCTDQQGTQTQRYGLSLGTTADYVWVTGNMFHNNASGAVLFDSHTAQNVYLRANRGYNPVNSVTNMFDTTNDLIETNGDAANPTASTDYTVNHGDIIISSTDSGNTDNAIVIKDAGGTQINPSTLSTLDAYFVPYGFQVNWGAFTGVAPTVVVTYA